MKRIRRFSRRLEEIERRILENKIEKVTKLQKIEILAGIIHNGSGELKESHFSSGSTVTRKGLEYACLVNKIPLIGKNTKKNYLRILLEYVGDNLQKNDFIDKGSTVKTDALIRIYRGLIAKSQKVK
jgi:hypothetical protein